MDVDRILSIILGIIAILFGMIAIAVPAAVFDIIVFVVGIILLIFGILTAGMALSAESGMPKAFLLASGLISIFIGLLAVITPYVATIAIGYLIAIWLVINGLVSIAYAASVKWEKHRILTGVVGVISLLLGIFLFVNPTIGTAFLVLLLGIFFIILGILSIVMTAFFWKK
jgi:uncharacterized membrane protein HdeD (DUF308 family)